MSATIDDKKLDGAGLATLWGIIKQYIVDNPSIPKATASVLGGIMVGTTLGVNNSGVLNLASGVVAAGTYKSVTVDTYGRVTAGSNPNTLAGYGITDAKISNGSIILGENSITPITSLSGYATQTWVQQQGYLTEETYKGTVTQVKVGTTAYDPTSGVVSLPAYPTTLPASDVYSWAKAASKPSYTASEVGAATSGHTHTTSIATSSGTNQLTLAFGTKYVLTAGGTSYIFTMPSNPNTNTTYKFTIGSTTNGDATNGVDLGTLKSETAAASGTTLSLVTTGEKATWNAKSNLTIGTTATTAAAGNHTHTLSIATSSGTNALTLAANTKYVLTAGGSTFIFTTPTDTNTWRPLGTGATDACAGNDSRLSDSRPASDVYSWAKASSKPTYTASEVGAATSGHTHTTSIATSTGTNQITLAHGGKYAITAGGTSYIFTMPSDNNTTYSAGTGLSLSGTTFSLATSGVTAGTYKRVTVDAYGRVTSGDNTDADTNTWRGIYVKGTSSIGTGNDTKALNFAAGSNISLSFAAAGTGSGQSGNANYGTITISATDTTYSAATQSAAGLMSAADKKKLDGIASGANAYSLPLAASGTRGGVKIGYTTSGKNYAVQLSDEKMYVNVPWTDTTYTFTNKGATLAWSTTSTIATVGGVDIKVTMPANPNTDHYAWSDITGKPSTFAPSSHDHSYVVGSYTGSGGQQNPNYFGKNKVGFLMMNTTVNSNSQYKDWIIMDCYSGTDVGGGVAFGVNRQSLGAYIMRSAAERTSWAESAELLGTHNYSSYAAKKTEAIKSISRSGTTFTATRCDGTTFTFTQQDNNTTYSAATQSAAGLMSAADKKKLDGIATSANNYSLPTASADTLGGIKVGTTLSISSSVLNLATSGVTAGTYKRVTVDSYGRVTSGDNTDADTNTWRGIYVKGTSSIGTGNNTKALNFAAGSNISLSFAAAGTGSGQSGNANYGTITINATDTTYSAATQSAAGLMSAADKKKLDGIASGANAYSLPTASSSALGGIKVGASVSGKNYAVKLDSSNCAYVNVPWTDNNTTYTQASLGQVYAYSTPPTSGTAVTATNSDYVLATGGILAVQFDTNPVPASATLNVNSKGAKNIKYKKAALAAGVIKAGDLATFMYDGTQYELLTVDRTMKAVTDISRNGTTFTATCVDGSTFTFTQQDNNTTYTLAGLMGSSAKGGTTQPIYWNGSAWTNTTYTLGKSVPSDAKFTDTNTWRNVYLAGTEKVGTGTGTKGLNFVAGSNVSITYEAAGTSSGQSGNASYFNIKIAATDTTYSSKSAASGGTDVSLVTTGEKYTWNNKSNLAIGTTATTAAAGNHDHTLSLATSTGTSAISLAANTKYVLTAGGKTLIFTTPPDNNTTYTLAGLMGSSAKGSSTTPVYWNGSAWTNCTAYSSASVYYASYCGSADMATKDGGGEVIRDYYISKYGGTITGGLTVNYTGEANSTSIARYATFCVGNSQDDGVFFGFNPNSSNRGGWIQSSYYGTSSTPSSSHTYSLILQPIGGYVGIGTSSPTHVLHVNGNAKFNLISVGDSLDQINCNAVMYIQHLYSYGVCLCTGGGNVGVGTNSISSYKLTVSGSVGATSYNNTSDIRKKNILSDKSYRIDNIANAPIFQFTWKDTKIDSDLHIGSSAQYWKTIMPEAVTTARDEIGTLSMQYDVIALASCISVAKETVTLKEKVALLETRVESLEKKIREYESN